LNIQIWPMIDGRRIYNRQSSSYLYRVTADPGALLLVFSFPSLVNFLLRPLITSSSIPIGSTFQTKHPRTQHFQYLPMGNFFINSRATKLTRIDEHDDLLDFSFFF